MSKDEKKKSEPEEVSWDSHAQDQNVNRTEISVFEEITGSESKWTLSDPGRKNNGLEKWTALRENGRP